jgi:hypothetical protein
MIVYNLAEKNRSLYLSCSTPVRAGQAWPGNRSGGGGVHTRIVQDVEGRTPMTTIARALAVAALMLAGPALSPAAAQMPQATPPMPAAPPPAPPKIDWAAIQMNTTAATPSS